MASGHFFKQPITLTYKYGGPSSSGLNLVSDGGPAISFTNSLSAGTSRVALGANFLQITATSGTVSSLFRFYNDGSLTANTFNEGGTNLSSKYLGINATAADSSKLGGVAASGYALSSHNHSANDITTGTLVVGRGGTGTTTAPTAWGMIYAASSGAYASTAAGSSKQVLQSNGAAAPTWATLDLTYMPDAWVKKSVKVATTANLSATYASNVLTASASGAIGAIDGITPALNDRILVKDQTTAAHNGIYYLSNAGSASTKWTMTRVTGGDNSSEIAGATVNVDQGTVNAGKLFSTFFKTTDTLGTAAMSWYEIVSSAGATMAGKFTTSVPTTGAAGLNLPHGTGPTTPTNGDIWTTTSGLHARVSSATLTFPVSAASGVVFAGPASGSNTTPNFRALTDSDIPGLDASKIDTGTLAIARGGTGASTVASGAVFVGPSSGANAAPSFRRLVAGDIPDLSATYLGVNATAADSDLLGGVAPSGYALSGHNHSGTYEPAFTTLSISKGGTGASSAASGAVLIGPSSGANAAPTWRRLAAGDIPDISATYATAGHNHNTAYLGINATATDSSKLGGTAAASYALLASPALTGTPTAPTAAAATNTTQIATTAYVKSQGYTTNTGTVTSVALSLPNIFTVTGSPVTSSGTLTAALANASSGVVFAGPGSGAAAAPTFRALVATDIPSLDASKIASGTLVVARGGTGAATASSGAVFVGPATGSAAAPSFRRLVAGDIPSLSASYLAISGGTLTGTLNGTSADFSGTVDTNALTINGATVISSTKYATLSAVEVTYGVSAQDFLATAANSGDITFGSRATGKNWNEFITRTNGKMEWGAGAVAYDGDVNLYRSASGVLKTDGFIQQAKLPIAKIYVGTQMTISDGTEYGVKFDTGSFGTDVYTHGTMSDGNGHYLVIPHSGYYRITAHLQWANGNLGTTRYMRLCRGPAGSTILSQFTQSYVMAYGEVHHASGNWITCEANWMGYLDKDTRIAVGATSTGGSGVVIVAGVERSYLNIEYIRP